MTTLNWDEALPSDASRVGVAPPDLRSLWTSIGAGVGEELFFPGSGGGSQASAGELKPGSTRAFLGAQSASSNDATNLGKLFLSSNSTFLLLYESAETHRVGGAGTLSHGSQPLGGVWVEQRGTASDISDGNTAGVSLGTAYSVTPEVWLVPSSNSYLVAATDVNTSEFTISAQYVGPGAEGGASASVYWTSIGTRVLGDEI
jgi:hypothetical protein